MVRDGNQIFGGEYAIEDTDIELWYCIPEIYNLLTSYFNVLKSTFLVSYKIFKFKVIARHRRIRQKIIKVMVGPLKSMCLISIVIIL